MSWQTEASKLPQCSASFCLLGQTGSFFANHCHHPVSNACEHDFHYSKKQGYHGRCLTTTCFGHSVADGASLHNVKPEVKQELSASRPQENHAEAALDAEENRKLLEKREAELDAEKESNLKLQRCMPIIPIPHHYQKV